MASVVEVIARIEKYLQTGERYPRLDADITTLVTRSRQAYTDPLTGALNRAGLNAEWSILGAYDPTVVMLDLDDFKPVNDRYGHAAGDTVLIEVSDRLATSGGRVVRLGGDEFVVILPTTLVDGMRIMRDMAELVATPVRLPIGAEVHVTASVGAYRCEDMNLSQALSCADAAMYRAKMMRLGIAAYNTHEDAHMFEHRPTVRRRDMYADVT